LDSTAVVRQVFDAFARRDIEGVLELIQPDIVFVAPTAELARGGRPYEGYAGMREYFEDVDRVWREIRLTPTGFERRRDLVLVSGRVWAHGSGRVVDSSAGWIFRLRDERVSYLKAFASSQRAREEADLG
jgi:ketosteroid isomerase-like protein